MVTVEQIKEAKTRAEVASTAYFKNALGGEDKFACGFAWVDVNVGRTNSKLAKVLIEAGFKKSYRPKVLTMWNPGGLGCQNVDAKEEGAAVMADHLRSLGLDAHAGSRLD